MLAHTIRTFPLERLVKSLCVNLVRVSILLVNLSNQVGRDLYQMLNLSSVEVLFLNLFFFFLKLLPIGFIAGWQCMSI